MMRFEIHLNEDEHLTCSSCGELKGDDDKVYVGDINEQSFSILCATCMDLEEAAIADGIEFTGAIDPEDDEATA